MSDIFEDYKSSLTEETFTELSRNRNWEEISKQEFREYRDKYDNNIDFGVLRNAEVYPKSDGDESWDKGSKHNYIQVYGWKDGNFPVLKYHEITEYIEGREPRIFKTYSIIRKNLK